MKSLGLGMSCGRGIPAPLRDIAMDRVQHAQRGNCHMLRDEQRVFSRRLELDARASSPPTD